MTRVKSLLFNQGYQDSYEGGKYIQSHRVHRSKKGRKQYKHNFNRDIFEIKAKKHQRYLQKLGYDENSLAY
jgi:hypothetical protein